jgi:hypothetical protein
MVAAMPDEVFDILSSGDRVFYVWGNKPEGATITGVFQAITVGKFGDEATVTVDGKPHIFPVTVGLSTLRAVTPGTRVRIRHLGMRRTATDPLKSFRAFEIAVGRMPAPARTDEAKAV